MRNALVRIRAAAARKDPEPYLHESAGYDSESERAVSEAVARPNPIEKEQVLDRYRWASLDAMAGFNSFASEAILAYSIKLSLAHRWSDMDAEAGLQITERVISNKADIKASEAAISENNESSE